MRVALITVPVAVMVVIITEVELVKGRRTPGKYTVTGNRRPASAAQKPKGPRYVVRKPGSRFTGVRQKSPKAPARNRKPAPTNCRTKNTTHKAPAKQIPSKPTGNATTDHPPAAGTQQDGSGNAVGHGGIMDPMAMGTGGMGMGGMGMGGMGMGGMGMGYGPMSMTGMLITQIGNTLAEAAVKITKAAVGAEDSGTASDASGGGGVDANATGGGGDAKSESGTEPSAV
ncbi:uncharacterized protein [Dermacentor albipictus]|uniref:uncharacterized protein isoform X2 n=1 Tax=Dermacentor albipictus TaxID=60249 RepID=UPI0031FCA2B1